MVEMERLGRAREGDLSCCNRGVQMGGWEMETGCAVPCCQSTFLAGVG